MEREEEMINKLLATLQGIGFEKEEVEDQVAAAVLLNLPGSMLRLRKDYGTESMFIELQVTIDASRRSLSVDRYIAIYRRPVYTDVKMENGVEVAYLETRMQQVDWLAYYHWKTQDTTPGDFKTAIYMEETVALLQKLATSETGARACNLLQYKYLPDDIYTPPFYQEFKNRFETSREFPVDGKDLCHVNLAYHLLSGRADDLEECIAALTGGWRPAGGVMPILEGYLSQNFDSFDIKLCIQQTDAMLQVQIPVFKTDGYYALDAYTLTRTSYPEINHRLINGVETWDLQQMMERPGFQTGEDVEQGLSRLWKDKQGVMIGGVLVHRYLQNYPHLLAKVPKEAMALIEKFPAVTLDCPSHLKLPIASNLLEGRWVHKKHIEPWVELSNIWMKLKDGESSISESSFVEIEGPTRQEFYRLLEQLPFYNFHAIDVICDALFRGEMTKAELGTGIKVLLEANPEKKTINVYSPDMRPIPVNFLFDPDWKREEATDNTKVIKDAKKGKHNPKDKPQRNKL